MNSVDETSELKTVMTCGERSSIGENLHRPLSVAWENAGTSPGWLSGHTTRSLNVEADAQDGGDWRRTTKIWRETDFSLSLSLFQVACGRRTSVSQITEFEEVDRVGSTPGETCRDLIHCSLNQKKNSTQWNTLFHISGHVDALLLTEIRRMRITANRDRMDEDYSCSCFFFKKGRNVG